MKWPPKFGQMIKGTPEIFNTGQGSQFTGDAFPMLLKEHGIKISMDGKSSYNDTLFIEWLWRTVKYGEIYLKAYEDSREDRISLGEYFRFYNTSRPHQSWATGHQWKCTPRCRGEYLYQRGSILGNKYCKNSRTLS